MFSVIPRRVLSSKRSISHAIIRRASSKVANGAKGAPSLPDVKLRALISLYHQSENFITPENLNQKIEEAFLPDAMNELETSSCVPKITIDELWEQAESRRDAPKTAIWDSSLIDPGSSTSMDGHMWSNWTPKREAKVIEALYGVDMSQGGVRQPGLEILKGPNEDLISVERAHELAAQRELEAKLRKEEEANATNVGEDLEKSSR